MTCLVVTRYQRYKTRGMLAVAWLAAPLCSLPQSYFFRLKQHPLDQDYFQCTTIGSFQSETIVRKIIRNLRKFCKYLLFSATIRI